MVCCGSGFLVVGYLHCCGWKCRLFHFICSIEFGWDDELFGTAGVSRCIKVFDFAIGTFRINWKFSAVTGDARIFVCRSSSVSWWIQYSQMILLGVYFASSPSVILHSVWEFEEHEKCARSVDFSCTTSSMLVSRSGDCKTCSMVVVTTSWLASRFPACGWKL